MTGHVAFGEADYDRGARAGRDLATSLRFRLTIAVEDLDHFVADPDAEAIAVGFVFGSAVGGRRPVERGRFQLLLYDRDPRDRRMRYELWFSDHAGHQLTLAGFKVVHDEPGFDVWRDTTVLYTRLLAGHVDGDDPDASVVASGILVITPAAFARQLTTFRASAGSFRSAAVGLYRFVRLFFDRLWDVYAAPASIAQPAAGVRSGARSPVTGRPRPSLQPREHWLE
jgi:cholesterol oxidase